MLELRVLSVSPSPRIPPELVQGSIVVGRLGLSGSTEQGVISSTHSCKPGSNWSSHTEPEGLPGAEVREQAEVKPGFTCQASGVTRSGYQEMSQDQTRFHMLCQGVTKSGCQEAS